MSAIVVGATGLSASSFLKQAIASDDFNRVLTFSRSKLSDSIPKSSKLESLVAPAEEWGRSFPESAQLMFSGVATTKASAGSIEKQRLIDHDLQLKLAEEAKAKGCDTFVLVSSSGASKKSHFAYMRLKGETEEDISKVGFRRVIILRPGPLVGHREKAHDGFGTSMLEKWLPTIHRSWAQSLMGYPVHVDEIAVATIKLLKTLPSGVHFIDSKEILEISK